MLHFYTSLGKTKWNTNAVPCSNVFLIKTSYGLNEEKVYKYSNFFDSMCLN